MIASRLNMISSPPPLPSSAAEAEKCRFFSAGICCIIMGEILFTQVYSIHHSVLIRLKLDLMDMCYGYYSSVLDSLDKGQISFMNVTVETDRSTHLSSLTDSASHYRYQWVSPPSQQMWGTVVNSAPFETMKANPHVNVSVMNAAYRRCIILFLLHLFLNIKWIW